MLARSDWLLKHGIASAVHLRAFARESCYSLTGINELKIVIFVQYYLTVLVYTKTTIHFSVGGQWWIFRGIVVNYFCILTDCDSRCSHLSKALMGNILNCLNVMDPVKTLKCAPTITNTM